MSAWKGGAPERHKFSGRMVILVRHAVEDGERSARQQEAVAAHVKGLGEYMVSGHVKVLCTEPALKTAAAVARGGRASPHLLPESISEHPEAAFLQFFQPPAEHGRDTVVMVAE